MRVLDVACGTGHAALPAARAGARVSGLDLAAKLLEAGRAKARAEGLEIEWREGTPRIREALRPGGVFLMVDIAASSRLEGNLDSPLAPFLFTVSTMHCMTVSLAAGGEGLGACWGEEKARELLAEAGFTSVEVSSVAGDPLNAYYVCQL
jgi:SAM-dependent methyltransferase